MWDVEAVRSRLVELRAWDRRRSKLVGAGTHRYRLRRPMPERDVVAFERRHDVVLPEAYRAFLLMVGRGGAGPGYGVYEFDGRWMRSELRDVEADVPGFLSAPFPHVSEWNEYRDEDSYCDPRLVAGSLPIATLGCTMDVRLVVTGAARGQVWMDDRGADNSLFPIGDDFMSWYWDWLRHPHRW